jgi:hypothetical protein
MGNLLSSVWQAVSGPPETPDVVLVPPLFKPAGVSGRSLCAPASRHTQAALTTTSFSRA